MVRDSLVTSWTTVFMIPPSNFESEPPVSERMLLSLSPSSSPISDLPMTFVFRLLTLETLYIGIPLRLLGVRLVLVWKVLGNTRRSSFSNCLRKGGREATRMPTESSVADQMVRSTPSQVGSLVFKRERSSTVLKMEHIVALSKISRASTAPWKIVSVHETEAEYESESPLGAWRQLDGGEIKNGCYDVDHVCDDVGDALHIPEIALGQLEG